MKKMNPYEQNPMDKRVYGSLRDTDVIRSKQIFDEILDQAEMEKERDYLTYDELERALTECLQKKFRNRNVFYKMISDMNIKEEGKVTFLDFLDIYQK